jgi:hypothetical protein
LIPSEGKAQKRGKCGRREGEHCARYIKFVIFDGEVGGRKKWQNTCAGV